MTITAAGDVAVDAGETRTVAERVLIVEDEPAARLGLEQLVKSWGFVAESASDDEGAPVAGRALASTVAPRSQALTPIPRAKMQTMTGRISASPPKSRSAMGSPLVEVVTGRAKTL